MFLLIIETKKLCRGSPPKVEKTMTENQKAEKSVGAHRGRPPKADAAIPDKPKPSNRNKQQRAYLSLLFDTLCYDMQQVFHLTIPFSAGIGALFQLSFDFSIYRQVFLIADGMLKACPEVHSDCTELYLHWHMDHFFRKEYRQPDRQVQTAIAILLRV